MNPESLYQGWMWDMFQEYVRKITRTATTGAMSEEEMQRRFKKLHEGFEIKIMVSDKVGMIVQFLDLDLYQTEDFSKFREEKEFLAFLREKYGQGKFKVNLYDQGTFVATKNFKIEEGPELWRDLLAGRNMIG